jgi:hypothetical protein
MATTRLRRTFAYPTDNDEPPDLDEEHQEALLTTLQSQDEATSTLYRTLFLALPVLTSLAYIPAFTWASGAAETFVALLSVSVPALAAWILRGYPVGGKGDFGGEMPVGDVKLPVRWLIVIGASLAGVLVLQSFGAWWAMNADSRAVVPAGKSYILLGLFSGRSSTDVVATDSRVFPHVVCTAAACAGGSGGVEEG